MNVWILPDSHLISFFLVLIEIFKSYENFYSLAIVERVCKENVKMYNYLKNSLKTVVGSNSILKWVPTFESS